jgi:hypothetical protein
MRAELRIAGSAHRAANIILHAPKLPRSIFYSPPMIGSRGKRSVGSEILPQESSSR